MPYGNVTPEDEARYAMLAQRYVPPQPRVFNPPPLPSTQPVLPPPAPAPAYRRRMEGYRNTLQQTAPTPMIERQVTPYQAPAAPDANLPAISAGNMPTPSPTASGKQPRSNVQYGNYNGRKMTGHLGPTAYGFRGRTGDPRIKGSAPAGLQKVFYNRIVQANHAMQKAGISPLAIGDGFRSYGAQVDVKRRKGSLAATPGRSIHGLGLAVDFSNLSKKQWNWLEKYGKQYGLVRLPTHGGKAVHYGGPEYWHWQLDPARWNGEWG